MAWHACLRKNVASPSERQSRSWLSEPFAGPRAPPCLEISWTRCACGPGTQTLSGIAELVAKSGGLGDDGRVFAGTSYGADFGDARLAPCKSVLGFGPRCLKSAAPQAADGGGSTCDRFCLADSTRKTASSQIRSE
jgi:hypothetical protein